MNRQSAIDDPVVLGDLLGSDELREIVQLYRHAYGVDVSILDRAGLLVSSALSPGGMPGGLPDDKPAGMAEDEPGGVPGSKPGGVPGSRIDSVRAVLHQVLAQVDDVPSRDPVRVAGPEPGTVLVVSPLIYDGQPLATFAIGPYRPPLGRPPGPGAATPAGGPLDTPTDALASTLARHAAGMMEILVHHAYTRYLTSALHAATIEQTFADLAAKNQRLELAVEHMQEVDRLKSSFLATMSHELRTPLTSVIGYAEMLHEGLAGPMNNEQRDYLQTILTKADQLLQLITGLLEASVLENGPLTMQVEPLALRELVESEIASMGPQVHTRRIELVPVEPGLPRALGDARRVRQVVRNLIANAIKFTGDGGVIRVDVQVGYLFRNADAGAMRGLRVVIADSGIGIPPEKQEHVFEPFFQVDSSSTRRYGGTGLGLTLAKSYIEANGGQIWVESTLGAGSAFTFSLPAEPEELARFLARSARS